VSGCSSQLYISYARTSNMQEFSQRRGAKGQGRREKKEGNAGTQPFAVLGASRRLFAKAREAQGFSHFSVPLHPGVTAPLRFALLALCVLASLRLCVPPFHSFASWPPCALAFRPFSPLRPGVTAPLRSAFSLLRVLAPLRPCVPPFSPFASLRLCVPSFQSFASWRHCAFAFRPFSPSRPGPPAPLRSAFSLLRVLVSLRPCVSPF
jgi:hypothetical protein